ncbi:hypothetical protein [Myxococcus xanthus]|uniref:hypothetical protein n=1 Tax=Myxococcus xanthus TaxID=34 RepID=UPI00112685FE|nr:hypothetical protein [Myxococcus xanthus]QDE83292.1 hypothetical protein BHS07_17980 [Myxococcus xanthus]
MTNRTRVSCALNRLGAVVVRKAEVVEGSGERVAVWTLPGDVGIRALPGASSSPAAWALLAEDCEVRARAAGAGPGRTAWEALVLDAKARPAQGLRAGGTPGAEGDTAGNAYRVALDGAVCWRQEAEATGKYEDWELYDSALHHAWRCRAYLLRRDGP